MTASRLPPLNAVRVFVAAARHMSFTLAAAELGVTHGAVSRRVKQLEQHLGIDLFTRGIRQVCLTAPGREFLAATAPALDSIAAASAALARGQPAARLRINVRASFAARWLIPRLPAFIEAFPRVAPQVVTSSEKPERLRRGEFDVVIRRSMAGWPVDLDPRRFLDDRSCLVAAPSLMADRPITGVTDLARHTFLHSDTREDDWRGWLHLAGASDAVPAGEMRFDHLDFALRAAADGLGLAISPVSLVAHDIAAGRLCRVLPGIVRPIDPYLIALADRSNPAAQSFESWVLDLTSLPGADHTACGIGGRGDAAEIPEAAERLGVDVSRPVAP